MKRPLQCGWKTRLTGIAAISGNGEAGKKYGVTPWRIYDNFFIIIQLTERALGGCRLTKPRG